MSNEYIKTKTSKGHSHKINLDDISGGGESNVVVVGSHYDPQNDSYHIIEATFAELEEMSKAGKIIFVEKITSYEGTYQRRLSPIITIQNSQNAQNKYQVVIHYESAGTLNAHTYYAQNENEYPQMYTD